MNQQEIENRMAKLDSDICDVRNEQRRQDDKLNQLLAMVSVLKRELRKNE